MPLPLTSILRPFLKVSYGAGKLNTATNKTKKAISAFSGGGFLTLAMRPNSCYFDVGATRNGRRLISPCLEGASSPLHQRRGGEAMVTYGELFAYSLVIIGIIGLVIQIKKK